MSKTTAQARNFTDADLDALARRMLALQAGSDTPVTPAQAEAPSEFVTWLRDSAEARHARKAANRETHVPWLDKNRKGWRGAANREAIWTAKKAGTRVPAVK